MSHEARAAALAEAIKCLDDIMVAYSSRDPKVDELREKLASLLGNSQYQADIERWMGANSGPTPLRAHPAADAYPKEGGV